MHFLKRNASQLPGRVACLLDARFIEHQAGKLSHGTFVTCGTNGKTTTNNLIADTFDEAGLTVICNRAGANMQAGVATCLLDAGSADVSVLEIDELSCRTLVPVLQPRAMLLLNLFRDQLDRAGEIDTIQKVLADALVQSPRTVLVYNADDPLSEKVALTCKNSHVTFGISERLDVIEDRVPEARFCQMCGHKLVYAYKTYAQLGNYSCPQGDFARPNLAYAASNIRLKTDGFFCELLHNKERHKLEVPFGGLYMVYNVLGAFALSEQAGVDFQALQKAIVTYKPKNGRLQHFEIHGRPVVLNLAKNPTGFNQNISLMEVDTRAKVAFFVINDNDNDGRDISWIYDVDFERLADDDSLRIYAGGKRSADVVVRLKYAGIDAAVAQTVEDVLKKETSDRPLYVLTNYSALWSKKAELEALTKGEGHV